MCHYGDNSRMTADCIRSIQKNDEDFEEFIISNNNPSSISQKELGVPGKITIINNGRNLGYPGGINKGLSYALSKKFDYVFIINNDCIVEKPFLKGLINLIKNDRAIGMTFAPLRFKLKDEYIYDLGGFQNWFGKLYHKEKKNIVGERPEEIDFAGCFLLKMEVIKKIGLMDENFFLYYDDIDFCISARSAGYKIFSNPKSYIYHGLSKTVGVGTPKAAYHQTRSALIYMKKHLFPSPIFFVFFIDLFINNLKRLCGNYKLLPVILGAYFDGMTNRINPERTV